MVNESIPYKCKMFANFADDGPPNPTLDVSYDLRCQSDPLRITRHSKVYGVSMCPVSERLLSLVMSDSRVLFIELKATEFKVSCFIYILVFMFIY